LARQIPAADASTQAGKWEKNRFMGVEITGKTLGVIGCGNIGSIVTERAIGLHMHVLAYDPFMTSERALDLGVEKVELDALLARADVITLHTPMTPQTKNILSAANLAKTKKGVRIINCAEAAWPTKRPCAPCSTQGMWQASLSTCSLRSLRPKVRCSAIPTSSARRILAPPRARRRKMSRCRSPSKCRII
jgi:hypothetical protein